jgi:hypothetical protein
MAGWHPIVCGRLLGPLAGVTCITFVIFVTFCQAADALRKLKAPDPSMNPADWSDSNSTDSGIPSTLPPSITPSELPLDKRDIQSAQLKVHMLEWQSTTCWKPGKLIPPGVDTNLHKR